ncbi:MAG: hypothetical protein ACK53T_20340 [Planctomycetota bacterium]|jgi:hypothetical protein
MNRRLGWSAPAALWLLGACATPTADVRDFAGQPPLDCAVLVVGGAFVSGGAEPGGTFVAAAGTDAAPRGAAEQGAVARDEAPPDDAPAALPIEDIVGALAKGSVFQRVVLEPDAARRAAIGRRLRAGAVDDEVFAYLQQARRDGHDYVLVVERLQDGPIEGQGTNGRWPVTFATWILLGVGMFIPDRTFESRATLRVTLRDLESGRTLHDPLLFAGPVDLSLVERTDLVGLLTSIVVPPFFVGDDEAAVRAAVRTTTERRLLSSLVRELKSGALRQRLRERAPAEITVATEADGFRVVVRAAESLGSVRLRGDGVLTAAAAAWERDLLAAVRPDGRGFRYEAMLPLALAGNRVQVLAATLRGDVASATFALEQRP